MSHLVTGASGGLGRYVVRALKALADQGEIFFPSRGVLDIVATDEDTLIDMISQAHTVVHLAAWTDTAACETDIPKAVAINTLATQRLVRACLATGTRLVFMSTDAVFSGGGPHTVDHCPAPTTVYGWSKFAAEQAVAGMGEDGLIVRANFFTRYCKGKKSFAAYVVDSAREGHSFECYAQVRSTPVFARTLAERIAVAVEKQEHGILHVASVDAVNRVEQASMICDAYGLAHEIRVSAEKKYDGRLYTSPRGRCGTVREEIMKMVEEEPL